MDQYVIMNVSMNGGISLMITCDYANCDRRTRISLWHDLNQFDHREPWMISGDFNVVLSKEEKLEGNQININDVNDFQNMINASGLTDGGYIGSKDTWSNNRLRNACILERLDRVLLNPNWIDTFTT